MQLWSSPLVPFSLFGLRRIVHVARRRRRRSRCSAAEVRPMACRGVHFALTAEQADQLIDKAGMDDKVLLAIVEELEESPDGEGWNEEWVQNTDKSWEAIRRCVTGGKLEWGDTPFHKCVLDSDNLYEGG